MARRIEIELTSARPDGSWTWRAAGALQPRGTLDGKLLYEGAKTGDVVRADADFEIDGITIIAITPPKEDKRRDPQRLEILGPSRPPAPGVTSSLSPRRRERAESGPGRPRRGAEDRPDRATRSQRGERPDRRGGPARESGDREQRSERPARRPRPERAPAGGERHRERPPSREAKPAAADAAAAPKAKRLNPGNTHRTALLHALAPEQQPIAEQLLRGGIPAVRTAIHLEREKASAEGRPAPNAEALLVIAEQLLPRVKAAEWRDRAEAAVKIIDDVTLRDLRLVVTGSDVARDDESRQLASTLREALEKRLETQRQEWVTDIRKNLEEGRVVRALRLSTHPPDPATKFPAEVAADLATAAGAAMTSDTPADRWAALLEAAAASPVRRAVKPAGLPAEPDEEFLRVARAQSGRIPALATMLGISMPPPPGPVRPAGKQAPSGRRSRPTGRRTPPKPAPAQPPAQSETPKAQPAPSEAQPAPEAVETQPAEEVQPAPETSAMTEVQVAPEAEVAPEGPPVSDEDHSNGSGHEESAPAPTPASTPASPAP